MPELDSGLRVILRGVDGVFSNAETMAWSTLCSRTISDSEETGYYHI